MSELTQAFFLERNLVSEKAFVIIRLIQQIRVRIVNNKDILELFPDAKLIKNNDYPENSQIIETKLGKIAFPVASLTEREIALLELFDVKTTANDHYNPWQNYLTEKGTQPAIAKKVRFLYLKVNKLAHDLRSSWEELTHSFFTNSSQFWLTDEIFIIVDLDCLLTKEDFTGIISAIDSDFDCQTSLQIGLIWEKADNLPEIFNEERAIFATDTQKLDQVSTIPEQALSYYLNQPNQGGLLKAYRQKLEENAAYPQLIVELYRVGGNLSKASKQLFLHRNTLEYRLDKLRDDFGLNLRKMDDLVFALMVIRSK